MEQYISIVGDGERIPIDAELKPNKYDCKLLLSPTTKYITLSCSSTTSIFGINRYLVCSWYLVFGIHLYLVLYLVCLVFAMVCLYCMFSP